MNLHSIKNETVKNISQTQIELTFTITSECDFFDGHFPQFKLLPAVAQTHIAVLFANKYFSTPASISKIRRIKFVSPVFPDTTVVLKLSFDKLKNSISFSLNDAVQSQKLYSSGTFVLPDAEPCNV